MRLKSLDGLRGVAALVVVLSHLCVVLPGFYLPPPPMTSLAFWLSPLLVVKYTPLRILVAGRAAVLVFFVLSGLVLWLNLRGRRGYLAYAARRVFRIVPPVTVAVLVAAGLYLLCDPRPVAGASDWFNQMYWVVKLSWGRLAAELLMSGIPYVPVLDAPTWSLVHEMRISLVFPVIVACLARRFWVTVACSAVLSTVALGVTFANPVVETVALSVGYCWFFVMGATIAMHEGRVTAVMARLPGPAVAGLWAVALGLLMMPMSRNVNAMAAGFGAALLICLCVAEGRAVRAVLQGAVPLWLGRVSYSLYLIHFPILLAVVHLGAGRAPLPVLCAVAAVTALGAAEICHRAVERPSIALGRRVAEWVEGVGGRKVGALPRTPPGTGVPGPYL